MNRALRTSLLGILGILAITAPFLWFKLNVDNPTQTVTILPAVEKGINFFQVLLPLFAAAAACIAWQQMQKRISFPSSAKGPGVWLATYYNHPAVLLGGAILLFSATFWLDSKNLTYAVATGILMLQALGLNITTGMTGLLVLGYAGFYGFGGYVFAIAQILIPGLPWWAALPFVFVLGGLLGWLVGLPCLRLRGDYLAIVTLGFAESFRELIRNLDITNADMGISLGRSSKFQGFWGLDNLQASYLIILTFVVFSVFVIYRVYHSCIGRAWIAIREDEIAASSMGVPVVRMKLLAFALSAAFAAMAGQFSACYIGFINPSSCEFQQSVTVLAMVILGGMGSIPGVLLGATILYLIPTLLRDKFPVISDYRLLIFGIIMVVMMLYRPQGLWGSKRHQLELKPKS